MKHLIFGLVLLIGFSAKAQEAAGEEVQTAILKALLRQADSIVVKNEDGTIAPEEKQLLGVFSKVILKSYEQLPTTGGTLSGFSLTCEVDALAEETAGEKVYGCLAYFSQAYFAQKDKGWINKESHDEARFTIAAIVPNNPNLDVKILNKSVKLEGRPKI